MGKNSEHITHSVIIVQDKMASIMRKLFQLSIFILVLGCATLPPLIQDVESIQQVKANFNRVWVPVNNFFSERNIPVKSVSMEAGSLETEAIKIPYESFAYKSDYCDCGTLGGIYVYREILGTFHVSIKGINKSTTAVTITADYRAALWEGNTFKGWVRCQSKGFVEKTFFQMLSSVFKEEPAETDQPDDNETTGGNDGPSATETPL